MTTTTAMATIAAEIESAIGVHIRVPRIAFEKWDCANCDELRELRAAWETAVLETIERAGLSCEIDYVVSHDPAIQCDFTLGGKTWATQEEPHPQAVPFASQLNQIVSEFIIRRMDMELEEFKEGMQNLSPRRFGQLIDDKTFGRAVATLDAAGDDIDEVPAECTAFGVAELKRRAPDMALVFASAMDAGDEAARALCAESIAGESA